MTLPQELWEVVQTRIRNAVDGIHTCFMAKIKEVNEDGTIDVEPYGKFNVNGNPCKYPIVNSVPILSYGCGACKVEFEFSVGDDVLCVCLENNLDDFLTKQDTGVIMNKSLNNAVAIGGFGNATGGSISISNGNVKLTVNGTRVVVNGDLEVTGQIIGG